MLSEAPFAPPGYQLERELGRGGMGVVYRALHLPTGAARAVKLMIGPIELEALERLRREGAALARAGGEGLVPVHEAGEHAGRAYLVLGLMEGGSLRERLRARGRLPWDEAAALLAPLARALARCHAAGLVHRDLKPDNVLFDAEGRPHLADFGCVRDLGLTSLTASGMTLGTLAYMAPEQLDGSRVGPSADVYSLGVMLHELVMGAPPIAPGLAPLALMREKVAPSRPRARLAALGAPPELDDLVDRALACEPAARPEAAAFAGALEALVAGEGLAAVNGPPRRRRGVALAAALGALLAGALALSAGGEPGDASDLAAAESGSAAPAPPVGPTRPPRATRDPPRSRAADEAITALTRELWGKRPLADLDELVEEVKRVAAAGASPEALTTPWRAALERFERAVEVDPKAAAPERERAAEEALDALLLAHWLAQQLDEDLPAPDLRPLTALLEDLPRSPEDPVPLTMLERVRQVVAAYRPAHMVNTLADIAENAGGAGHVQSATEALREAIAVDGAEVKPRVKLGVLLAKQALEGGLEAHARAAAEVLDGALRMPRTSSQHEMSTLLLARAALYAQAGEAEGGLALLDAEEHVPAVKKAFERGPAAAAAAGVLRARLELSRGGAEAAARALRAGAAALERLDPGAAARLVSLAERIASPAEREEVAAELARWPLPL